MSIQDQIAETFAAALEQLEADRAALTAALVQTKDANRLTAARPLPAGDAGRRMLWGGSGRLVGWSLAAVGAAVTVTLRDSRDASGDPLAVIAIAAAGSASIWLGEGVSFGEGLFADAVGGSFTGAVWIGAA